MRDFQLAAEQGSNDFIERLLLGHAATALYQHTLAVQNLPFLFQPAVRGVAGGGKVNAVLLAMLCYVVTILLPQGVWMQFLFYGVSVNLTLCFLNLLPVPPLDGFAVLRALLGLRVGKVLDFMQKYGLILVLLLSLLGVLNSYLFLMRGLSIALFARLFG